MCKTMVFFEEYRLEFKETKKRVSLELSTEGHIERVGEWSDEKSLHYVKKDFDVNTRKALS